MTTAAETPKEAARRLASRAIDEGYTPQALHEYTSEDGIPLFWRIRAKHPRTGEKWIRPMSLNGQGYKLGEPDFPEGKPLYRLHDLATRQNDPLFIVEGETCVDVLADLGVLSTTSGAADSAGKADWRPVAGRSVTIWPDFDEAGARYADEVEEQLRLLGCDVRRVDVDTLGLTAKGDCVDWLKRHPEATVEDVLALPTVDVEERSPGGDWPELQPLVADLRSEPYPIDALPDPIRAAVDEVQGFTQAPYALVSSCALSALSTAGQGLVDVARSGRLTGPTSLYFLTLADSGERKSTADAFFSDAIRVHELRAAETVGPDLKKHRGALAAWTAEKGGLEGAIKSEAKKGGSTEELRARLEELEQREPQAPLYPRILLGDTTQEALTFAVKHEWPSVAVLSAEGGSVFGCHAMGKEIVMRFLATLNSLYSGEALQVSRRTSESYTVLGARLTLGLQVQPAVFRDFTDQRGDVPRGSGFFARFLISWPETTQGTRLYRNEPGSWLALDGFNARIGSLLDDVHVDEDGVLQLVTLQLSQSAFDAWRDVHDEIERDLAPGGELEFVRDVASKAADNIARMAALFHVFSHGPKGPIDSDAIERASRIVAWHLNESRRIFGELSLPVEQRNAAKLEEWLLALSEERGTNRIPAGDALRLGPLRKAVDRDAALGMLEDLGRARLVTEGRRKDIEINPALFRGEGGAR